MTDHVHGPNRLTRVPDAGGVVRAAAEILRSRALREAYDATPPREDLCDFDAWGMDIIEGRRV
jgi:hypothetical protein